MGNDSDQSSRDDVIIVHLRLPRMADPFESRTDPIWEIGSFGCTGCHFRNLMNPKRISELEGARLAFAQGGPSGFRLVKLTPRIEVVRHAKRPELRWYPRTMPFKYGDAPLLINNDGETDFLKFAKMIARANRTSWAGAFSSCFRSRRQALPDDVATEMIAVYDSLFESSPKSAFAKKYWEAMPCAPPLIDLDREQTYNQLLSQISDVKLSKGRHKGCRPKRVC